MVITVNYNDDTLTIDNEQHLPATLISLKKLSPNKLKEILEEIFHTIPNLRDVKLEVIDEDTCRTVDEW